MSPIPKELSILEKFDFERKPVGVKFTSTKPHVHNYDEAVFFIGSDPYHLDDLRAEVEISISEEEEKHVIDKPYVCMAVSLTGKRSD